MGNNEDLPGSRMRRTTPRLRTTELWWPVSEESMAPYRLCRRFVLAMLSLLLASGAWAAKKQEYDPFKIPREQFRSSIKIVALRSPILPDGLSKPDEVSASFESLITAGLTSAGMGVVPAKEFDQLWKQGADSAGGLFDATTGKLDPAKLKDLRASVGRALKEKFNADAVLFPQFRIVKASFSGGRATWDGVKQSMTKGFWGAMAGGNTYGTIPAVSLIVFIDDDDGKDLFVNSGGLQVAVKLGGGGKFVDLPVDSLFTDPERNATAVSEALKGLAETPKAGD